VLRNAARSNATQWRQEITEAKHRVETRTLTPADLRAPTITLSNFGTIAGRHAALIIVPPQVAILGAGRITERSVRGDKGIVLHRMLPLSLTFDHRAVSGGEAARFMRAIVNDLQSSA
jgi:pyruvate dehydrogenase E2 component (dihydrolipoamide acetyltransferase)